MKFLHDYISQFRDEGPNRIILANALEEIKRSFDVHQGGNPEREGVFEGFVQLYNWLGQPETKHQCAINQNLARNLPGALMQDYLLHLVINLCRDFPMLDVFTECRVPFGEYPLWDGGIVSKKSPAERTDLASSHPETIS